MSKGVVRLYLAGGMAANVGLSFYSSKSQEGFADMKTCFIDTSLSNIRDKVGKDLKEQDIFVLDGVDGSGRLRASNAGKISENIKGIVNKFHPEDVNIVVFSLSGGSGSIIGPLLMKELLEKEKTAVGIVVGSEESKISIENTVKTIQSLDHISRNHHKPIVMSYYHNSQETPRKANDTTIIQVINALSILCSKENKELDTADVTNFFNHQKVTSVQEGVSLLYVTTSRETATSIDYPISTASLYTSPDVPTLEMTPEYACAGYTTGEIMKDSELHFVISQSEVKKLFDKLTKRLTAFTETSSARVQSTSLGGEADSSGLVL